MAETRTAANGPSVGRDGLGSFPQEAEIPTAFPFAFGSSVLPGLAKVNEECGEAVQQIGKLMMTGGSPDHWQGGNLIENLTDELADVSAAIAFFRANNEVDHIRFGRRYSAKLALFEQWHAEQQQETTATDGPRLGTQSPIGDGVNT